MVLTLPSVTGLEVEVLSRYFGKTQSSRDDSCGRWPGALGGWLRPKISRAGGLGARTLCSALNFFGGAAQTETGVDSKT